MPADTGDLPCRMEALDHASYPGSGNPWGGQFRGSITPRCHASGPGGLGPRSTGCQHDTDQPPGR